MTHVLTVTLAAHSDTTVEVHMLNPGEHFERFGGSSRGLTVVGKTASLITRTKSPGGTEDVERDVYDPKFWEWMSRMINGRGEFEAAVPTKKS